ncbi:MAG: NAD(P)H-dependent oxidoreductase [Nitrososphaeraceae archaeon]
MIDLSEMELPIYNPNISSENDKILTYVTREVIKADSFVLASPDYHGSMSGAMKNLLDYYWKEFAGKTFGYIVASHEKGLTVMDQMRTAVRQCYGWSMPYGISIHGDHDFDEWPY